MRPQINLYSADVLRPVGFYRAFGEGEGAPIHVELALEGFTIGIAAVTSAVGDHGLPIDLRQPGRGMELALWTDDVDAAFSRLVAAGAPVLSQPHDWLEGRLRVAWIADPDRRPRPGSPPGPGGWSGASAVA